MGRRQCAMEGLVIDSSFWKGRRVFITGHTGFKGGWLLLWLRQLGAHITGYALEPTTTPAFFNEARVFDSLQQNIDGDIRDLKTLSSAMHAARPEIVIHMAAQALVQESYVDPVGTYSTNVMGVVNLYEAVRGVSSVKAVLNITSDKCYENKEWYWGYRETEPMGGCDPYSSSKGCSELISAAYRQSFFEKEGVGIATARSGNVIGGGDWSDDRIVPDAMRAFINKKPLLVRNPFATRPWQHVLEPLSGYIILCQALVQHFQEFSEGWNFGPNDKGARPVSDLANIMVKGWGDDASWVLDKESYPHEACFLKLDCSKANSRLKWQSIWSLERSLNETVKWYKAWSNKEDMYEFSLNQIKAYQNEIIVK